MNVLFFMGKYSESQVDDENNINPTRQNYIFAVFAAIGINSINHGFLFLGSGIPMNINHIIFVGNRVYNSKGGDACLLSNFNIMFLNGKNMSIESNIIVSTCASFLVKNRDNSAIRLEMTDILNIIKNEANSKYDAFLFYNVGSNSTTNMNSEKIAITDNIISPTFTFGNNDEDKYSVAFRNKGTININLYSNDSSFELLNNPNLAFHPNFILIFS